MDTVVEDIFRARDMHRLACTSEDTVESSTNHIDSRRPSVEDESARAAISFEISRALVAHHSRSDELVCGRVYQVSDERVSIEWHDARTENLDFTHLVAGTLTVSEEPVWSQQALRPGDLLISGTLSCMLAIYHQWRTNELRELANAHEIRVYARDTVHSIMERLTVHACGRCCPTVIIVYRPLKRRRKDAQIRTVELASACEVQNERHAYARVADDELKRSIIQEWQETFATDKFQMLVCGPCGRRTSPSQITLVSPTEFDLTLLRNDLIPRKAIPTTYSFSIYERALLNPKGLLDRWRLDKVRMCEACRRELVGKGRKPRLSLANFLYYGWDEIPGPVRWAMDASTFTERRLLGRARCSRISYRFTELKKRKEADIDEPHEHEPPEHEPH